MTESHDWDRVSNRLGEMFARRVLEIRREVPASEIVEVAVASLSRVLDSGGDLSEKDIDPSGMKDLLDRINESHRSRIRVFAESIGEIDRLDDPSLLLIRSEGLVVGVKKENALKYLALGSFP